MAEETHLIDELPVKRPQEEEAEENGGISVKMEKSNEVGPPECISTIIPGWLSEISPMCLGKFATLFTYDQDYSCNDYIFQVPCIDKVQFFGHQFFSTYLWVRHYPDGTRQYIEGATNADYVVTADDVDKFIAVECIPMNEQGQQAYPHPLNPFHLLGAFTNGQQCVGNGARQCSTFSARASSETTWTMRTTFPE
ncbi:unnamed protein product [Fraxinus pennsylvanica]|uniref:AIR9-like A9 domain-containing protein n=1 Tax=Fraxinus pennsylvanica TaxID=56036 RepID=A0AAD1ZCD7_9LAMI|nr:unnamed protein product [Fraxinus pennsylvanica]